MERNIREFLRETGVAELRSRCVLTPNKGCANLLQGKNVAPLIDLMWENGVTKVLSHDGTWSLTSDGRFSNPKSREAKKGLVKQLKKSGNVFWGQNPAINPYYELVPEFMEHRYASSKIRPFARITFDPAVMGGQPCIRDMPVTVARVVQMVAEGHSTGEILEVFPCLEADDIVEALGYAAKKVSQVNTFIYRLDLEQEEDGRWSALVPALLGCNAWGYTREETLMAIRDTTQMFLEVLNESGDSIPREEDDIARIVGYEVLSVTI